jgi:NAD-dependent deacetylase
MNVLVLTGAGVSAESGIPTFRDANGLWEGHRVEDVATPQAFQRDPDLVHAFYNARRQALQSADIRPNAAHHALADFEAQHRESAIGSFLLVTQNIDDLHQRSGSQNVLAMHGQLTKARCLETDELFDWKDNLSTDTPHPRLDAMSDRSSKPSRLGWLRPHVVWFGEIPIGLNRIQSFAESADLFISIGTSAVVYPAAGIVEITPRSCQRVQLNLESTHCDHLFDQTILGNATQTLPRFLNSIRL